MARRKAIEVFADAAELAYRKAYVAFERPASLEGADLKPLGSGGECFEVQANPRGLDAVEVCGALKIELLPRRGRESGRVLAQDTVSVLMSSKDIYYFDAKPSLASRFLAESYVSLGYYKPHRSRWATQLALRYEFGQRGACEGHPIFHAQVEDGTPGQRIGALPGVPAAADIDTLKPLYKDIRMPTANMIGATVLLKLAADHLPHTAFTAVLRNFQSLAFFRNWRCKCDSLDDEHSAQAMLSSGWYGCKP